MSINSAMRWHIRTWFVFSSEGAGEEGEQKVENAGCWIESGPSGEPHGAAHLGNKRLSILSQVRSVTLHGLVVSNGCLSGPEGMSQRTRGDVSQPTLWARFLCCSLVFETSGLFRGAFLGNLFVPSVLCESVQTGGF